jgi:hypothetical protein
MDWTHLYSAPIKPPNLDKLDTMKKESASPQDFGSIQTDGQTPVDGGCSGKGHRHRVDPGANVEGIFKTTQPDFQKARVAEQNQLPAAWFPSSYGQSLNLCCKTTNPWLTFFMRQHLPLGLHSLMS